MHELTIWLGPAEAQTWRELILTGLVATGAMGLARDVVAGLARAVGS